MSPSSSSIAFCPHSKTGNVYMFVNASTQSITSQIFEVVVPLGENLDLFSQLGFEVQANCDHKTQKNKALLIQSSETLSE